MQRVRGLFMGSLFFATLGCDQVTKVVAREALRFNSPLSYMGDSVRLQFAQNPGAFLSLGAGMRNGVRFWIFTVGVALILAATGVALFKNREKNVATAAGLSLILGGGIGNLIDRVAFGSVTDFLILGVGPFRTGIFNIADMAIMAGVFLVVTASFNNKRTV